MQEAPRGPGVSLLLHADIEHVAIRIDGPPKPVLHATNWDHKLIEMPFVGGITPVPFDAAGEMPTEPVPC